MQLSVFRACATVAYVKYSRASSAAAAQEHLHDVVLSSGSFKLKVMLAQAPHSRHAPFALSVHERECYTWHVHEGHSVTRMGAGHVLAFKQ
jgi:hypothetical protein